MAQVLGRGLSSLIPQKINKEYHDFSLASSGAKICQINPGQIIANPRQPRKSFNEESIRELADSIKEHGLLQPLVVSRVGEKYQLIAGERRWRACQLLGLKEISVIVRQVDEQKKLEMALIENIQRENLNPVDTAIAYNQLVSEFNLSQEELAQRVFKPRSSVANSLRLLQLSPEILEALVSKQISEAHAKYLLGLDKKTQEMMFRKIKNQNLSVKDTDKLIKSLGGTRAARVLRQASDQGREELLKKFFSLKAEIKRSQKGGRIILDFNNEEELNFLINKIQKL